MNEGKYNLKQQFISHSLKTCSEFYRTPKFRLLHGMKRNFNADIISILKSKTLNTINRKKFFKSFHKSLMHRKLSYNLKYKEIQNKLHYTDRERKPKNYIENYTAKNKSNNSSFQYKYDKFFLTNYNYLYNPEKQNYNILYNKDNPKIVEQKSPPRIITDYNCITEIPKNNNIRFRSNVFLPLDLKKFKSSNYPDLLYPKISDFVEDIKMLRVSKYINNLKTEQHKKESNMVGYDNEAYDLTIYSLEQSIKLLNNYKRTFLNYNKFLIEQIKREKKMLNNYILDEKMLKEQVILIQKKFDDSMIELEILNNFKNLFYAIKNRTKIKNDDGSNKTFLETIKEKLKSKILLKKKSTFKNSPRKDYFKKRSKIHKKEESKYLNEKVEKFERFSRQYHTILNVKFYSGKKEDEKIKRFNSIRHPLSLERSDNNKNKIDKKDDDIFDNYDIQKELNSIGNNILEFIKQFNKINYDVVYYKLLFEKEINSIDILIKNKQIKGAINELDYCKKYNLLLISKLKLLKSQNEDYSLFFFIYHKLNGLIKFLKIFKIKNYHSLIDNLLNIYDNNTIFNAYKNEKNGNGNISTISYLEVELIRYIYSALIFIEKLVYSLIEGKNNYLKNNYYSEKIEEFENQIDNVKKLFNNKSKKNEEIIRREKVKEKTIKKLNKFIYLPMKKVADKYKIYTFKDNKIKKSEKENEIENLLTY